jgi:uncharacterized protein YjbI with pentapeptide repeats
MLLTENSLKYIIKRASLLLESFKDARRIFMVQVMDLNPEFNKDQAKNEVALWIDRFKALPANVRGDITKFIPLGFQAFKDHIENSEQIKSRSQKNEELKKEAIIIDYDYALEIDQNIAEELGNDTIIVVPLSADASKKYGKETKWCISANERNAFDLYANSEILKANYYSLENFPNEYRASTFLIAINKTTNKKINLEVKVDFNLDELNEIAYSFEDEEDEYGEYNEDAERAVDDLVYKSTIIGDMFFKVWDASDAVVPLDNYPLSKSSIIKLVNSSKLNLGSVNKETKKILAAKLEEIEKNKRDAFLISNYYVGEEFAVRDLLNEEINNKSFKNCNFEDLNFSTCQLTNLYFENCNFNKRLDIEFSNAKNVKFINCKFVKGLSLKNTSTDDFFIKKSEFLSNNNWQSLNLKQCNLHNFDFIDNISNVQNYVNIFDTNLINSSIDFTNFGKNNKYEFENIDIKNSVFFILNPNKTQTKTLKISNISLKNIKFCNNSTVDEIIIKPENKNEYLAKNLEYFLANTTLISDDVFISYAKNNRVRIGNVDGVTFANVRFSETDHKNSIITNCKFINVKFDYCIFNSATIQNCVFENCNFKNAGHGYNEFEFAKIVNCEFRNTYFKQLYLTSVLLASSKFNNCEFSPAIYQSYCNISNVVYDNCTINENSWVTCNISDSNINSMTIINCEFNQHKYFDFYANKFINHLKIQNTKFSKGVSVSHSDNCKSISITNNALSGARFYKSGLNNCNIENNKSINQSTDKDSGINLRSNDLINVRIIGNCLNSHIEIHNNKISNSIILKNTPVDDTAIRYSGNTISNSTTQDYIHQQQ